MVAVKIVERPRHPTNTLRRVNGDGLGGRKGVTRLHWDACMQRVESEEHTNQSVAETLGGGFEAARVDEVEAPSFALGLGRLGRNESEERVVDVGRVAKSAAEGSLAELNRSLDPVHLVRPVALQLDHLEVQVGQIGTERCGALDADRLCSVVGELETTCNSVVFVEHGVRQRGGDVGDVVVEVHNDGRNVAILAVSCWKSSKTGLALDDFVRLISESRHGVAIGVGDVDRRQTGIASSNVWELAAQVAQTVDL